MTNWNRRGRSQYYGVAWHALSGVWRVKVKKSDHRVNRERYFYKRFRDEKVAARVYDFIAKLLHGPDARLNFDGEPPEEHPRYEIINWMLKQGTITPEEAEHIRQYNTIG